MKRRAAVAGLLVLAGALAGLSSADVGGGRGHPATPWRITGPEDIPELEAAKKEAAECQTLTMAGKLVDESDTEFVQIHDVAISPQVMRDGDVTVHEFAGKDATGQAVAVSFANVERFVVKAKTDTTVTLTVTVWPDISAKDLLDKQPTWKELNEGFRREVDVEIPIETRQGRALEFAGGGPGVAIEKLPVGAKGDFYGGSPRMVNPRRFWFAIPSVAKDADYPFRMMPAA
jgi:hypothetical protein